MYISGENIVMKPIELISDNLSEKGYLLVQK